MAGLLGKKIGMTSIYDENGNNIPCTVIEAGPCIVTQVRTVENDGYSAVQLAYEDKKEKHTCNAMKGHFAKANTTPKRVVAEFERFEILKKFGETVSVTEFVEGEFVDVLSKSKGKGFQGVVRRHGFAGVNDQTHGQHNRGRHPGSIGASSYPSRVFKGMRMAGRMGGKNVKSMNLRIIKIIADKNLLVVKGSVAGPNGTYVKIEKWK